MSGNKSRLLLIGGYPKGYSEPFDKRTVSGRRLHAIIEKHGLKVTLIDLWENKKEEDEQVISSKKMEEIFNHLIFCDRIIALGEYVYCTMIEQMMVPNLEKLPHPASRRKIDLDRLEKGLISN